MMGLSRLTKPYIQNEYQINNRQTHNFFFIIIIIIYLAVGAFMGGLHLVCDFITFNFAMQTIDQTVICVAETLVMSDRTISVPVVFGVLMDFLEI